jgi:hypothetical protein
MMNRQMYELSCGTARGVRGDGQEAADRLFGQRFRDDDICVEGVEETTFWVIGNVRSSSKFNMMPRLNLKFFHYSYVLACCFGFETSCFTPEQPI